MKTYKIIAVTLVLPEDQDLLDLVERIGKGLVSPWVKDAMRRKERS